jgi:hypothetical protein
LHQRKTASWFSRCVEGDRVRVGVRE